MYGSTKRPAGIDSSLPSRETGDAAVRYRKRMSAVLSTLAKIAWDALHERHSRRDETTECSADLLLVSVHGLPGLSLVAARLTATEAAKMAMRLPRSEGVYQKQR